jgi:DNA-binding MarR family transcriptional regulator
MGNAMRDGRKTKQEGRVPQGPDVSGLIADVEIAARKMGAQSVVISQTMAELFGLHMTDLEVLDHIVIRGEVTPGELVETTGLTSGAMTALLDRLETAGYVERSRHPTDRRKVVVRPREERVAPIRKVYEGLQEKRAALWSTYTANELGVIRHFLVQSTEISVEYLKMASGKKGIAP